MARSERLVVNVSDNLKAKLDRIAKEREVSVSALVATVLGKYAFMEELEETWRYEAYKKNM